MFRRSPGHPLPKHATIPAKIDKGAIISAKSQNGNKKQSYEQSAKVCKIRMSNQKSNFMPYKIFLVFNNSFACKIYQRTEVKTWRRKFSDWRPKMCVKHLCDALGVGRSALGRRGALSWSMQCKIYTGAAHPHGAAHWTACMCFEGRKGFQMLLCLKLSLFELVGAENVFGDPWTRKFAVRMGSEREN